MNNTLYWIATGLVALVFIGSGMMNLSANSKAKELESGYGGRRNQILLSVLKIMIGIIWIFPQTGVPGALLAIAYFGGAIAVHLTTNTPVVNVIVIQIVIWVASAYRFPELLQRMSGSSIKL